jgi:putative phosphotransacetylase
MRNTKLINQANLKAVISGIVRDFENTPYIKVGVSNRHIHLSQTDLDALFGNGYQLTKMKDLSQTGQFACKETLRIIGRKGDIKNVRILGPVRKQTQLELSLTDTFTIGVQAPINESGILTGAGTAIIENPNTGAQIERAAAIVALRHVHLTIETAAKFGFKDKQFVNVAFDNGIRDIVFKRVLLRVSKDFCDEMHIDTDEANAGYIKNGDFGLIVR